MKKTMLIGCIKTLTSVIRTRYFYVNTESGEVRDVTLELCNSIEDYNAYAKKIQDTGKYKYSMTIPYQFKNGLAVYSFGCGLSHYLQEEVLESVASNSSKSLSFPLEECSISMYTPKDVNHILSCKGVFDIHIVESLKERFNIKEIV